LTLQPLNINSCIRNVNRFLERIIGEDIKLKLSLTDRDVLVHADKGHIEQVLMNLASNARDAMPTGGILSIGTDLVEIDEDYIQLHGYGTPGHHALIIFADNGSGMNEETRQRIFEPFFTTKETGKGTGLGLSIIYGIVKQHNGHIGVYSEPGRGTTFRILLPLMPEHGAAYDREGCREFLQGGTETILVVDDEASIREYLNLFLTTLGYTVLLARDGREAIEVFLEEGKDIDLVLMDLIMPNINGNEAARELRKMKTGIQIIFTSGYPYDIIKERNFQDDKAQLLMKPVTPTDLARKIRVALKGGAGK
jgi:CheY-like chemotaxis protein